MEKSIVLAAGCFWGTQEFYRRVDGVLTTRVGYAQGRVVNPVYEDVKRQTTGHTEVCEVVFDDSVVSLKEILDYYFDIIDPTSLNKQGGDIGESYRTGIYSKNIEDLEFAREMIAQIASNYDSPIVVEVQPLDVFYDAEEYHQDYLVKNPTGYCHIDFSKLKKGGNNK